MFHIVNDFEKKIADFYNAPYAIATDSCTHAIELCLRYKRFNEVIIPNRTYISVAFLPIKLNLKWSWSKNEWKNYYYLGNTNIIDAAVYWKKGGYISGSYMCLSFQFQKHLSLGRGGMILCDNYESYSSLKKMSYDGRLPNIPWREQNINLVGFHYYMTPETAAMGIDKLGQAKLAVPREWVWSDWPDLSKMDVFQ
tara:strand:- start:723 stop:1310 length:588 start_codon:yes stop_codon:yes gene_type:complete